MKLNRWGVILLAALLLGLAAWAPAEEITEDTKSVTLGGLQYELSARKVGLQVRGWDCEEEEIWRLDVTCPQAADFPGQTLYFTRLPDIMGLFTCADVNMDGYLDLDIFYNIGASNVQHTFFFWNPDTRAFETNHLGGAALSNYALYPEKQLLLNQVHDSAMTGTQELYRWATGNLRLVRRVDVSWMEETLRTTDTLLLRVFEPGDGEPVEVRRETISAAAATDEELLAFSRHADELLWFGLDGE